MNVTSKSIALGALGLAWLGCGSRTSLLEASPATQGIDAGSPMRPLDSGSLADPSATSLDASGDAERVAVRSCPVGFPKSEMQPFDKSCRSSLDCEFGVLPGCCSSYAISYTHGQKATFDAWAAAWKNCLAPACQVLDCAGDGFSFEDGEAIRESGRAPSVGVACDTQARPPSCVTYPNAIPAANSSGECRRSQWDSPGLVCFGSDPGPYQKYLPRDAGVTIRQCPTERDFPAAVGEGSCAFIACGPLVPSAVSGLSDAGAQVSSAGSSCCFWLNHVCGV
jgi:hypothetical protein